MCGIVGYVGPRPIQEVLLAGLEKLEYRGYDSAGISLQAGGRLDAVRAVGNLARLRDAVAVVESEREREADGAVAVLAPPATAGIGHTRWATHGGVTERNAHPVRDPEDRVHVVVNGIVENYMELKQELSAQGATFRSETDVETIAHLIANELDAGDGLVAAVRRAYARLRGHYAFVAMAAEEPGVLVGVRKECPLVVGRGNGEQFIASGIPAFLAHTREIQVLEDDELVIVEADGVTFESAAGPTPVERAVTHVDWDADAAEKGGHETFMLKEIHEQADAVAETIADRTSRADGVDLPELDDEVLANVRRIIIVACGTSYHAGLIGRYALEQWARVPVEMDIASEYRYRNPVVGPGDLVIGMTQSGETLDTLAAMRLARERGATVIGVTNILGSQVTRDAHMVLATRAGLEVSVAATKTFVAQIAVMYLLALRVAELKGTLDAARRTELVAQLKAMPGLIAQVLEAEKIAHIDAVAEKHFAQDFFLYLGRHVGLPVCLEGALKLKEISYIATDAYAAGEMKHGPIALLDQSTPVVVVATESPVLEKVISNIQEVRARGAQVVAVTTEGHDLSEHAEDVLPVPATDWILQPLLAVIPLQLFAYRVARLRGLNVDQPRNLAKTVTVE